MKLFSCIYLFGNLLFLFKKTKGSHVSVDSYLGNLAQKKKKKIIIIIINNNNN